MKAVKTFLLGVVVVMMAMPAFGYSDFAVELVDYSSSLTGSFLYNDPYAVLGKPSTNFQNSGFSPATGRVKLVEPAWNVGLDGEKLITTLNTDEYVTVKFDHRVEDDPLNPYGIDLIVFGNSFYVGSGFVSDLSDMETYMLVGGAWFEGLVVSVSQDGETWYTYDSGPYCDTAFPTQAYLWDSENGEWTDTESDFTKPVDPDLAETLLAGGMSAADAIALYNGSGGGTGFDLAESDYDWIQYVRVEGISGFSGGEVDAFADVAPASTVPVPAAVWLLGSGLLGVIGIRRKNR